MQGGFAEQAGRAGRSKHFKSNIHRREYVEPSSGFGLTFRSVNVRDIKT